VVLVDLNVLLDVVQQREPYKRGSAAVLEKIIRGDVDGALPAHAFTTMHYIVGRYRDRKRADEVVDWLIRHFVAVPVGRSELLRGRALGWGDFEDAGLAAAAESGGCTVIVTRNVKDFPGSPVPARTPEEYLVYTGA